jgi:hypothetical protein
LLLLLDHVLDPLQLGLLDWLSLVGGTGLLEVALLLELLQDLLLLGV